MFHKIIRSFIRLIYPSRCIICDGLLGCDESGVHKECYTKLVPIKGAVCMHCGRPVSSAETEYCHDCRRKASKQSFIQGKALFLYTGEVKNTMYRFKYSNRREYADFFAEYAFSKYKSWMKQHEIEAIVPVPMYSKKKRKRGYDQAEVWAKKLSVISGLPMVKCVKRKRNTTPMKNLNDIDRKNNVKNAFQYTNNIVQYNYILLVDDIFTTGSTAEELTRVLLEAGVKKVYFLSVCIGEGY